MIGVSSLFVRIDSNDRYCSNGRIDGAIRKLRWEEHLTSYTNMAVSENRGTPKSSMLIGFSIINHPFWGTTIFGNTHILFQLESAKPQSFQPHCAHGCV